MRTTWPHTSSVPAEVDAGHIVEAAIVWPIEVAQSSHGRVVDDRVRSALGLTETARRAAPLRLLETREALRRVEVEMLVGDEPFQAQKVLESPQLAPWVGHQALAADEVEPSDRESSQPAVEVARVETDADGAPRAIHRAI